MKTCYTLDLHAWSLEQAEHLKNREFHMLDFDHLIEEIEGLSGSDKRAIKNHLKNVLVHMLKSKYQPDFHTKSWDHSIAASRFEVKDILDDNPSLKQFLPDLFKRAYRLACLDASNQTKLDLSIFPKECLWTIEEVIGS